ncbi:hypothetical protein TNCV_5013111 [Trichonephila clavipes]|nr:hypothetical protein TNCV_5013111 [Trichonephila clavipes]
MSGAVCQRNGGESDRVLASNCAVIAKQTIIVLVGLSMAGQHVKNSARFSAAPVLVGIHLCLGSEFVLVKKGLSAVNSAGLDLLRALSAEDLQDLLALADRSL